VNIGIGFPAMIPGAGRQLILEWARRADQGPFSSLGLTDRVAYGNHDPLIALAAAAAVTERIRLMTTVLLAPTRPAGILAKQAASLDALSGGRLTLGLGIGSREDDYRAAPASFRDRGRRFEQQLEVMHRAWSGQEVGEGAGRIGPPPVQPGGPEVLIGGYSPAAVARVGRWGRGYITGGGADPERAASLYAIAEEAWRSAGREGRPRFVGAAYYALGPDAAERGGAYLRDYYGSFAERISLLSSDQELRSVVAAAPGVGMDEIVLWATVAELDQVDRLAEIVAG